MVVLSDWAKLENKISIYTPIDDMLKSIKEA
jgi:hypothetical protein